MSATRHDSPQANSAAEHPPLAARFGYADTRFGQLHYVEQGSGPTVLLLHQTPRSCDEFRELLPLLATRFRAVAMDMPGFGNSAGAAPPHRIEAFAAGALALLEALDVPRAHVFGHHTGGAVALEMAAGTPERVGSLVLSSTPWAGPAYREAHRNGPGVDDAPAREDGGHLLSLWAQRRPYYPARAADLLDRFIRDALAPGVDPVEGHRACARYRMEDRIGLVRAPTLVIGATGDPFSLPAVEQLTSRLGAAASVRTTMIDGGMIPLLERHAVPVADAVLGFLGAGE